MTASMPLYLIVTWEDKGKNDGYWKVVPYANPDEPYPPLESLVYTRYDVKGVGEVIRVGITSESRRMYEHGTPSLDLTRSMATQGMLQTVEIYIG
jgi:hypothetical protein